jgi:hypothetical protein
MTPDSVLRATRRAVLANAKFPLLRVGMTTKLDFSAALYAPLRLNEYENAHDGTTFEYDKPSTQFGQFHNADIDKVAQSLDHHLLGLIKKVSTCGAHNRRTSVEPHRLAWSWPIVGFVYS